MHINEDHGKKKDGKSGILHKTHLGHQELNIWNNFKSSYHYSMF